MMPLWLSVPDKTLHLGENAMVRTEESAARELISCFHVTVILGRISLQKLL